MLHWQFRPFVSEDRKLLSALADLENAKELKRLESQPVRETVIIVDDISSKPTEVPSEPVPVITPEPPKDQSKLLAENDRLKAEIDRLKKENKKDENKLQTEINWLHRHLKYERESHEKTRQERDRAIKYGKEFLQRIKILEEAAKVHAETNSE